MAYDEALASRVRAILHGQDGVAEKKMFGGVSFMVNDQMCCGVLKDDLVLRVGADHSDEVLSRPHVRPFDFTGRPTVGMVYVNRAALTTDDVLRVWVQAGLDYVRDHPKTVSEKRPARRQARRAR